MKNINEIISNIMSTAMSKIMSMDITCSYDEDEDMYLFRVFMVPSSQKKNVKKRLRYYLDVFAESDMNMFYSIQIYTEEETAEYYPERLPALMPPVSAIAYLPTFSPSNSELAA